MPIRAVLFDVHETLGYFAPDRVRPIEVQRLLAGFGLSISYQAYEAARQAVLFIDGARRPLTGWTDLLALLFDRLDLRVPLDLLPAIVHMYERRHRLILYPDALPALEAARAAGLITGVFTSLPAFMLGDARYELEDRIDHYCDNGLLGVTKGDPRFCERITQRLNVPAESILCVGDELLGDCELPAEAGWRPVLIDRAGGPRPRVPFPVIAGLDELSAHWMADARSADH